MSVTPVHEALTLIGAVGKKATGAILKQMLCRLGLIIPPSRLMVPSTILISPVCLKKANPDRGNEIYRGRFQLGGETVITGPSPPFVHAGSDNWQTELHSFSWLADLAATGNELQRAQARALLGDWIAKRASHHRIAVDFGTTARRFINLLFNSSFLMKNAGRQFEQSYFTLLGHHVRWLQNMLPLTVPGRARLDGAIALAYGAVCLDTGVRFRSSAFQALCREVDIQILSDGGHISRNAKTLVEILLDLLPLVEIIERQKIELPVQLCSAIDRAVPAVRMLCHGDGGLAAFNGVDSAMRGAIRSVLERDEVGGKPVSFAKHSGYCRLSHRKTTVLMDCGLPPAPSFASCAHASPLAFELSEGAQRIIVNCGAPPAALNGWGELVRTTAAHSAAVISDRSSVRSIRHAVLTKLLGGPVFWGLRRLDCEIDRHEAGTIVNARHDGYLRSKGLVHERTLWLSADGRNLRGEDNFLTSDASGTLDKPVEDSCFAIRFHLHPSLKATMSQDRASVTLLLPDRSGWSFSAKGARLSLEDSLYLVDRPKPQRTVQIVLSGIAATGHKTNWAFKKLKKQARSVAKAQTSPELPF